MYNEPQCILFNFRSIVTIYCFRWLYLDFST